MNVLPLFRRATPSKLPPKGCCPGTQLGVTKGTGGVTVCTVNWKTKYQIPVHLKINVQLSGTANSSHNLNVNASILCWGKVVAESVCHGDLNDCNWVCQGTVGGLGFSKVNIILGEVMGSLWNDYSLMLCYFGTINILGIHGPFLNNIFVVWFW